LFFVFKTLADDGLSEEIVQDSFMKLWNAKHTIESESHLKFFLYKTARNACIDRLREKKKLYAVQELENNMISTDHGVLAKMIHSETLKLIIEEVAKLPKIQREVFHLTYFEDMNTDEIVQRLGISPNAVFVARSKAVGYVRKVFKDKLVTVCSLTVLSLLNIYRH
jgi:RNA polymerase sigma-70 factor (ECF subfamily)